MLYKVHFFSIEIEYKTATFLEHLCTANVVSWFDLGVHADLLAKDHVLSKFDCDVTLCFPVLSRPPNKNKGFQCWVVRGPGGVVPI